MGSQEKLTKQGVRDLNHLTPKKRPVAIEPSSVGADETHLVAPVAIAPDGVVAAPTET
jgi:hypothetical protein